MVDENKLFGQFGVPGSREVGGDVTLPATAANYFIHSQHSKVVKESIYCGMKNEGPLEHLYTFTETCNPIPP